MVLFGNLLLAIAAILFLAICNLIFFTRLPGGDAGVGYAWSLILAVAGFSICLAIVTAIIGWQGGFAWVSPTSGQRTLLVVGGLALILTGNGFFMMGENPGEMPALLRPILKAIPAILPPLLLLGAAILLNGKQATVPTIAYKLPVYAGLFTGMAAVGILMMANARRNAAILRSEAEFKNRIHQNHLNDIDSTDVMKDAVFLYVFTDANHAKDVRDRALAKIKSRPDWQEELVRRLQNDWAPEAFRFLASNEVDDKTLFPDAVRQGVLIQAKLIREEVRRCRDKYDLYEGRFTPEVERALRTVAKFEGLSVDFRPAVQDLRNALDEPTDFKKPKLPAIGMLDDWLKKH